MADYTITASQEGVYEIALPAGTAKTIEIATPPDGSRDIYYNSAIVSVHSGTDPIYYSITSTTPVPKDQNTGMVAPNMWQEVPLKPFDDVGTTLALVSNSAATVSVSRS